MISTATIPGYRPAASASAFWRQASVATFKDIPVTCLCDWEMTFKGKRLSGWALDAPAPSCLHHGKQAVR